MQSECQICGTEISLGMVVCPICSADERAIQIAEFSREFEVELDDPDFDPDVEDAFGGAVFEF